MPTQKQKYCAGLLKYAVLGAVLLSTAACVVDPYPAPPPAAAGYYPGPYSYYDYPAYAPYYYGPPVGVGVAFGDGFHGGYHHWH